MEKEKYKLKILVDASSFDEASSLVKKTLQINPSTGNLEYFSNTFRLDIKLDKSNLNNEFYNNIKESKEITLLKDEASLERGEEVLKIVSKVEILLRRLVVYASGTIAIDNFSRLILEISRHTDLENLEIEGSLNPKVSNLSLGELKEILGFDMSWEKDYPVKTSDLLKLILNSDDLADLQSKVEKRMKSRSIWDIISDFILKDEVDFGEIAGQLGDIKDKRNEAAHFRIITDKDLQGVKEKAKHITKKITIKEKIDKEELPSFDQVQRIYTEDLQRMAKAAATVSRRQKQLGEQIQTTMEALQKPASRAAQQYKKAIEVWEDSFLRDSLKNKSKEGDNKKENVEKERGEEGVEKEE